MSQFITLQQAVDMTTMYRANKESILATGMQGKNILLTCETFTRDSFDALLRQQGCEKIRIYFSMTTTKQVCLIAVGVNGNDQDMLPDTSDSNVIVEEGLKCPVICPPPSPLNSD
jgi:hypothetical protein